MSNKKTGSAKPKTKKPKQIEIPMTGPGVENITDKKLIALGDEFIEIRDEKAELATKLKDTEKAILERMDILNIKVFRFSDQEVRQKDGARHVKIKTVKVDTEETAEVETGAPADTTEGTA